MGHGLVKIACDLCMNPQQNDNFMQMLTDMRIPAGKSREFASRLHDSDPPSIDLFLEQHRDFIDIGKAAIAHALMPFETPDRLPSPNRNRSTSWYAYLADQMRTTRYDHYALNELTVITYNYDRSIEAYFRRVVPAFYNRSLADCKDAMQCLRFIHLHGQLGDLNENSYIAYGTGSYSDKYVVALRRAMKGIKIIHEVDNATNDAGYSKAKQAIHEAKRIVILGFGFGRENLERLNLKESKASPIYATAYGMSESECNQVDKIVGRGSVFSFGGHSEEIRPFLTRMDCLPKQAE